jgi:hypothetical protein
VEFSLLVDQLILVSIPNLAGLARDFVNYLDRKTYYFMCRKRQSAARPVSGHGALPIFEDTG